MKTASSLRIRAIASRNDLNGKGQVLTRLQKQATRDAEGRGGGADVEATNDWWQENIDQTLKTASR